MQQDVECRSQVYVYAATAVLPMNKVEGFDSGRVFVPIPSDHTSSCADTINQLLSAKVTEKHGITSRLTELIMASEKKRDAKLNEIMKKMSSDGSGGGAAGAGKAARPR